MLFQASAAEDMASTAIALSVVKYGDLRERAAREPPEPTARSGVHRTTPQGLFQSLGKLVPREDKEKELCRGCNPSSPRSSVVKTFKYLPSIPCVQMRIKRV